jgi:hypothetical protein
MYTRRLIVALAVRATCVSPTSTQYVRAKQSELATRALQVDGYPDAGERRNAEPERRPPSPRRRDGGFPPGFGLVRMQSQNLEQETEKICTGE